MFRIPVMVLCAVLTLAIKAPAQSAPQGGIAINCRYANTVEEMLTGDTLAAHAPIFRQPNGSFRAFDSRFSELAAYLNHLRLPTLISKAHVVLKKSLVLYEPGNLDHTGKPWYDHAGKLIKPEGDKGIFKDKKNWTDENFRKIRLEILDWQEKHLWGPFVLYENHDYGKGVFDVEVALLDKAGCWIDRLAISFYRLPKPGSAVNLDNVDAGNEYQQIVLMGCNAEGYANLWGGGGPLYPERAKDLRYEWDRSNAKLPMNGLAGNNSLHYEVSVAGKKIVYETVAIYPHLEKPVIVVVNDKEKGGWHLVIKLPKYFNGRLIPTFVSVECTKNGPAPNALEVRYVRGAVEHTFRVTISYNPRDAIVDWGR